MKNKKFKLYEELKVKDSGKSYIFNNGLFYAVFNEDADKFNEIFGFMLKQMGDQYRKCEFPIKSFDKYRRKLEENNVSFEIIEKDLKVVNNIEEYSDNMAKINVIEKIMSLNLENKTPKEALDLLYKFQEELKV